MRGPTENRLKFSVFVSSEKAYFCIGWLLFALLYSITIQRLGLTDLVLRFLIYIYPFYRCNNN